MKPVSVVHVSQNDGQSGAGTAARRLHESLRALGIESSMLVGWRHSEAKFVETLTGTLGAKVRAKICAFLNSKWPRLYRSKTPSLFSPVWPAYGLVDRHPLIRAADVVCLYWVAGAFLAPSVLKRISAPMVWRLSDMWPFTGGCHYSGGCRRYEHECGACPQLGSYREIDLSRVGWRAKANAWRSIDLTVVAPSRWLADCARQSSLFRNRRVEVISTGVDLSRFKPRNKANAREIFGLPTSRRLILSGAFDIESDPRKGFSILEEALLLLSGFPAGSNCDLVVFGSRRSDASIQLPLPVHNIGLIQDEERLADLYSAADVTAVPSLEDNLPNVALEAIACGTPVVAFGATGMPEIVDHGVNGYLAEPYNARDLARGIDWALEDTARRQSLSAAARRKAETHFCAQRQAEIFHDLFLQIARKRHGGAGA